MLGAAGGRGLPMAGPRTATARAHVTPAVTPAPPVAHGPTPFREPPRPLCQSQCHRATSCSQSPSRASLSHLPRDASGPFAAKPKAGRAPGASQHRCGWRHRPGTQRGSSTRARVSRQHPPEPEPLQFPVPWELLPRPCRCGWRELPGSAKLSPPAWLPPCLPSCGQWEGTPAGHRAPGCGDGGGIPGDVLPRPVPARAEHPGAGAAAGTGMAWGGGGDVGLVRGTTARPDPASPLLALPFPRGAWPGLPGGCWLGPRSYRWHTAGTQPARPRGCRIDRLNGELMASAPLGRGSGSAAAIGKAEPGVPGALPSGTLQKPLLLLVPWVSGCRGGLSCP